MISRQVAAADAAFDALVCDVSAKLERGEIVDLEQIAVTAPEHFERLRQLLPTLHAMAGLGVAGSTNAHSNDRTQNAPLQWRVLGDYHIVREVGRGGMGIVYEAEQISLERRVAIKILPFAAVLDPRHLQRFKNEAMAAAHLDHPNIVEVYGIGCERSIHFYAMRFVDGVTLADVVEAKRRSQAPPS